jgi:hypothetical protein
MAGQASLASFRSSLLPLFSCLFLFALLPFTSCISSLAPLLSSLCKISDFW